MIWLDFIPEFTTPLANQDIIILGLHFLKKVDKFIWSRYPVIL